jgi:hypothetical protein
MLASARRAAKIVTVMAAAPASLLFAGTAVVPATPAAASTATSYRTIGYLTTPGYDVRQVLRGSKLRHTFIPAGTTTRRSEPLTGPDDIAVLGRQIYAAFQNGVGPQGEASSDGNTDSSIVEFTAGGRVIRQWNIKGKCDGLAADPRRQRLIATVNEDAHSSIYTITPGAAPGARIRHYRYDRPLPHNGGTDAISVDHGRVLISASAPGTTGKAAPQPSYPAVYQVTFDRSAQLARISAFFGDEARARVANTGPGHGKVIRLALTDPDSSEIAPRSARRFAGDFMLTSQADQEQIFARPGGDQGPRLTVRRLTVLRLSQSVDDTAWALSPHGRLYGADATADTIDVVTGRFPVGSVFVAVTPCDAGSAPATCPAPGFPPNYLGSLNPRTGQITRVPLRGPAFEPKGIVFIKSARS